MRPPPEGAFAAALRRRDPGALATIVGAAVVPSSALVPRPWGGHAIARHQGRVGGGDGPIGESFELAAAPSDPEAAAHASTVMLEGGDIMPLSDLLHACPALLGDAHILAFGHAMPLLPKLLDVQSLLSVQAHPPGSPELYVVIDAEPGATMHLGLREDTDPVALAAELRHGVALQTQIAAFIGDRPPLAAAVTAWLLGDPEAPPDPTIASACAPMLPALVDLRRIGQDVLGRMHTIGLGPGTVVHNCVAAPDGGPGGATLHALGNAQGRAVLALEIRRVGPTLRAWDHGRLPIRALDIAAAIAGVPMTASRRDAFVLAEDDRDLAIDSGAFTAERLRVGPAAIARDGRGRPEFVHVCTGTALLVGGRQSTTLHAGQSALVPAGWASWGLRTESTASVVIASVAPTPTALAARTRSLRRVRELVACSEGPRDILAIANGGDGPVVAERLLAVRHDLFRRDDDTRIVVHEELTRRGQLLGMIDAVRGWTPQHADGVALGIMLPGQGTRLSPVTQRLHGIKPFVPMPIRTASDAGWMSAGTASLHSWVLIARALQDAGFRGIAWKWGDEPQLPSAAITELALDLSAVDAVRFGKRSAITEDLARNKEWLLQGADGRLVAQLRRRDAAALCVRLAAEGRGVRPLVHIGSPALSYRFMDALVAEFGDQTGWLDIDGYLFEALTHDEAQWQAECARDAGLRTVLVGCPDFYARARAVRARLEDGRGAPLAMVVVDCGADTWWGDMGQLGPARDAFARLADPGEAGEFARRLAAIDDVVPDRFGNRVVGSSIPGDGSVRDAVVIDSWIGEGSEFTGAVVLDSVLGVARLGRGAVVMGSTVAHLVAGEHAWVALAVAEHLDVADFGVHTTMPGDPQRSDAGLEQWAFDTRADPSTAEHWTAAVGANPTSFRDKATQMRQRERTAAEIEADLNAHHAGPLAARIRGRTGG